MVLSKLPSAAAAAAAPASSSRSVNEARMSSSRVRLGRIVSSGSERGGGPRQARDRHLHDVGEVRKLRELPDDRGLPEAPGQERLHVRVRERPVRSERHADDRRGAEGGRQLDQTRGGAALLRGGGGAG